MIGPIHKNFLPSFLAGILLSSPFSVYAANDLDLSKTPLAISASVEPNVMFLLDNSGSMDNIIWDKNYTIAATETWHDGGEWTGTSTFMTLSSVANRNCAGTLADIQIDSDGDGTNDLSLPRYSIRATLNASSDTRCLILPDILDSGRTRYTGNYLDYLFQQYSKNGTTVDLSTVIPYKTRLMALKDVTKNVVNNVPGMKFGLTVLNNSVSPGQRVIQECGAKLNGAKGILQSIDDLKADGGTPLAESMYEITRYFRGLTAYYKNVQYKSPITESCQKNFVVAVTDGEPTGDTSFNAADSDIAKYCPGPATCTLPNYDGLNTTAGTRFSDRSSTGATWYLDDLAKFAYDVDMRTGGKFDTEPFVKQNVETFAFGFAHDDQSLRDAGHYGSGLTANDPEETPPANYFSARTEGDLVDALKSAISNIAGRSGSASSVTASTGFVGAGGTSLFQATYTNATESGAWSGNLNQLDLGVNTSDNSVTITKTNKFAANVLADQIAGASGSGKPTNRNIFSYKPGASDSTGIPFLWGSLSTSQQGALNNREEILNYLWGVQVCETGSTTGTCPSGQTKNLRTRLTKITTFSNDANSTPILGSELLGTIVNSTPIYIQKPLEYYPPIWNGKTAPENADDAAKYSAFKEYHDKRRAIIYAGANDGMLHAFDADTLKEVFAYVPNEIIPQLSSYSSPNFSHDYFVDGTPNIIDVFYGTNVGGSNIWKTVLVGGLNKGGQGIYALDVTDPDTFDAGKVLWEFTDDDDRDLGYTFSRPAIVRMHNGRWAAVFGNGYNNTEIDDGDSNNDGVIDSRDDTGANDSETGDAVLYIVDIHTGKLIQKISTFVGFADDPTNGDRPNGLSTVAPVDINDDYIVDYIYAGDLFGNLWRFDVTSSDDTKWAISGNGSSPTTSPIFVAMDDKNIRQPITARPDVTLTDTGGLMIYFGTGQYLQLSDRKDTSQQTFYGVLDIPGTTSSTISSRSDPVMLRQYVASTTSSSGQIVRTHSTNGNDRYTSWYIDLPESGERVVGPATVRGISRKRIIYTSIIPTSSSCSYGGTSWLTELDARDGSRTAKPVFDINFDGKLNSLDNASNEIVNGWSQEGIHTTPAILTGKDTEFKILSSSTGTTKAVGEAPPPEKNGARQSWRQIK